MAHDNSDHSTPKLVPSPCGRPDARLRPAVRDNGYSTSMACRSWYQPQLPHTRWGRLTAPQRLQALRPPGRMRHAEALRLRPLAFEVFFLGTAMGFDDPRLRLARLRPASLPARRPAYTSPPSMPGGRRPRPQPAGPVGLERARMGCCRLAMKRLISRSCSLRSRAARATASLKVFRDLRKSRAIRSASYTSLRPAAPAAAGPVGNRSGTGPAQSVEHRGASGRARIATSRTAGARSIR